MLTSSGQRKLVEVVVPADELAGVRRVDGHGNAFSALVADLRQPMPADLDRHKPALAEWMLRKGAP